MEEDEGGGEEKMRKGRSGEIEEIGRKGKRKDLRVEDGGGREGGV